MSDKIFEHIKEAFGSNATYVEGLLERFRSDPKLVDESWQSYFGDLLSGKMPAAEASGRSGDTPVPMSAKREAASRPPAQANVSGVSPSVAASGDGDKSVVAPLAAGSHAKEITGPA